MLQALIRHPRRVLITLDAVGGVWRYAVDLARTLTAEGIGVVLAGLGPEPSDFQRQEAESIATLAWLDTPPDWTAKDEQELDGLPAQLEKLVRDHAIDLLHLNAPSQACNLDVGCPVIVVSHSCVVTWFHAVKGTDVPAEWHWQRARNRLGFDSADLVLAPSHSHARMLEACYGPIDGLTVVYNSSAGQLPRRKKESFALAAARWWDEGKNGRVLVEAASKTSWPIFLAGSNTGPGGQNLDTGGTIGLGELPNSEVRVLMARAGIFVSPSLYEPFGLAALEAAKARTPLVLADIPTYREIWGDEALFFSPGDSDALAATIDRLAGDEKLRKKSGRLAALRASGLSSRRQLHHTLAAYQSAMART